MWLDETGWSAFPSDKEWSSTGDGMLAVLEAMEAQGWWYEIDIAGGAPHVAFSTRDAARGYAAEAATLPRAMAEAARAAILAEEAK